MDDDVPEVKVPSQGVKNYMIRKAPGD